MKRLGGVWSAITAFDNLLLAYRKARRGKASRPAVAYFGLDLERELLTLQRQLRSHSYRPGEYRLFTIYERKPRRIAAAPFRDRVVHHALMNIIEPPLDRRFIFDSYACRRGKGVHQAVDRFQGWARRYPYVLKLDIQRYYRKTTFTDDLLYAVSAILNCEHLALVIVSATSRLIPHRYPQVAGTPHHQCQTKN